MSEKTSIPLLEGQQNSQTLQNIEHTQKAVVQKGQDCAQTSQSYHQALATANQARQSDSSSDNKS